MFEKFIRLIIESKIDQISLLAEAIRGIFSSVIKEEILLYQLELGVIEAVTNAINHAYHRKAGHEVEVIVSVTEEQISIRVMDSGDKYSKESIKNEMNYNPSDFSTLPESGWGLFLLHQVMDEVSFLENEGKNVVLMRKKLK